MPLALALTSLACGCQSQAKISAERAQAHAAFLGKAAAEDVREVRSGLPLGAEHLAPLFEAGKTPSDDPKAAEDALVRARNRVQDLRTAKSTFFAAVDQNGLVIRNDQEQDAMAGKNLFTAYPELKAALDGKYVESHGSMPEASGVKGRGDAQWVAAAPVKNEGTVKGLYATGWSWSSYAYRLENAIRSELRAKQGENEKMPLVYVYVVVDAAVYGAPLSPDVSLQEIKKLDLAGKAEPGKPYVAELEITGRDFGLAALRLAEFKQRVVIAVLRSET